MKIVLTSEEIKNVLTKFASVKASRVRKERIEIASTDITFLAHEPEEGTDDEFILEAVIDIGEE